MFVLTVILLVLSLPLARPNWQCNEALLTLYNIEDAIDDINEQISNLSTVTANNTASIINTEAIVTDIQSTVARLENRLQDIAPEIHPKDLTLDEISELLEWDLEGIDSDFSVIFTQKLALDNGYLAFSQSDDYNFEEVPQIDAKAMGVLYIHNPLICEGNMINGSMDKKLIESVHEIAAKQESLIYATDYMWSVFMYYNAPVEYGTPPTRINAGYVRVRFIKGDPLNETQSFDVGNIDSYLYHYAQQLYDHTNWDWDKHSAVEPLWQRFRNNWITYRDLAGKDAYWFGSCGEGPEQGGNNRCPVKAIGATSGTTRKRHKNAYHGNKDSDLYVLRQYHVFTIFDLRTRQTYKAYYDEPYATPVLVEETEKSEAIRPRMNIQHAQGYDSFLPEPSSNLILLNYYIFDPKTNCTGIGGRTANLWLGDTVPVVSTDIYHEDLFGKIYDIRRSLPFIDSVDRTDKHCASVYRESGIVCEADGKLHASMPSLNQIFPFAISTLGVRMRALFMPFNHKDDYYNLNYTLWAMPAAFYTPATSNQTYVPWNDRTAHPEPYKEVSPAVPSIASTFQQALDDVKITLSNFWELMEHIDAVIGQVEAYLNLPGDVLSKAKGFWGFFSDVWSKIYVVAEAYPILVEIDHKEKCDLKACNKWVNNPNK